MKIYLAGSLHTDELKTNIKTVVDFLRSKENEVYSPMELKIPNAWDLPNHEWAKKVYDNDIEELTNADMIVCIYNGFNFAGGTGTAWELGYARAMGKDVIVLCTDIKSKQSLMIINSGIIVMPYEEYKKAWEMYMDDILGIKNLSKKPYIHPDLQDQS
jgi:nucleoside deoxyribosyltransferase